MLKTEETLGGPLSVKQLNTVLVFIGICYSDYCKLYYYYNKYFFLIIAFDVKKGYPLLVQSESVEAIDVNITPHMSNTTFLGYGL